MGDLSHMIDGFPNQDVNAALVAEAGDEDALAAVESISRDGRAGQILVLADSRDPAWFARLFYAGATEVIAAGPLAASSIESNEACAVRGPNDAAAVARPACNNEEPTAALASAAVPAMEMPAGWPPAEKAQVGAEGGVARYLLVHLLSRMGRRALRSQGDAGQQAGAPLVAAISGRGGVGKSTLVASLAYCSAHMGLRAQS